MQWLPHYNLTWALGDVIAGLTGTSRDSAMVQSLTDSQWGWSSVRFLARRGVTDVRSASVHVLRQDCDARARVRSLLVLCRRFVLYPGTRAGLTVPVLVYAFFATSKDVTIGPVAVMSLEVSKVIASVQSQPGGDIYSGPVIATALAFITGFIVLAIGLLRVGWLVEFIPAPAVSGFMTGSAISIAAGQIPGLLGFSSRFDTRASTYKVIINTFKNLRYTTRDAAYGLSGLVFLYTVRYTFTRIELRARNPLVKRIAFFATTLRTAFVIIFLTIFAWVHLRGMKVANYDISILKTVPSGFQHMGRPVDINSDLIGRLGSLIPVSTIILLLEHIAIAKSFGRVNNYKIDPNQELIAIGVTNLVGTLFNAYPATGSFSRSAIKAKAGVRTPLAGWITGLVVVVALYALTGAFYCLSLPFALDRTDDEGRDPERGAISCHHSCGGGLDRFPATGVRLLEDFAPRSDHLVRRRARHCRTSLPPPCLKSRTNRLDQFTTIENGIYTSVAASAALLLFRIARPRGQFLGRVRLQAESPDETLEPLTHRDVYIPVQPDGVINPLVKVEAPPPGVIIYRFDEAFLYPNASYYSDIILAYAKEHTRRGRDYEYIKKGDRPWNGESLLPFLDCSR